MNIFLQLAANQESTTNKDQGPTPANNDKPTSKKLNQVRLSKDIAELDLPENCKMTFDKLSGYLNPVQE